MKVHGLTDNQIQFFINYGPFGWFVTCVPLSWLIDRHGSRLPVLFSIVLVFVSSLIRIFTRDDSLTSVALLHISFFFNGLAGPIAMSACSKISEVCMQFHIGQLQLWIQFSFPVLEFQDWFPPEMRSTATAVMNQANMCCGLVLWLMIPLLVSVEDGTHLHTFNLVCLGMASLNLLMALFHFPNHPAVPPSASALGVRLSSSTVTWSALRSSVRAMLAHRDFLLLFIAYSLLNGFASMFIVLLPAQLDRIGLDQSQAAWVGLVSAAVSALVALLVARCADPAHLRRNLVKMLAFSLLAAACFACLIQGWLRLPASAPPSSTAGLALVSLVFAATSIAATATTPTIFEMSVEFSFGLG